MVKTQRSIGDVPTPYIYEGVVKPQWLDDNGHMNVAYYMSAFDDGGEVFFADPGIGWDYTRQKEGTVFIVSSKVDYRGELMADDRFCVTTRLIDFKPKMLHVYYEIDKQANNRQDGHLCATAEILYMHISFKTRKSAEMPDKVLARLEQVQAAHKSLATPPGLGAGLELRP